MPAAIERRRWGRRGAEGGAPRARRTEVLQRTEAQFDPIPFDAAAARTFGRMSAAVAAVGRTPRRRLADVMIAAVAAANDLALYTTNPADYVGLDDLVDVVALTRPAADSPGRPPTARR